MVDLDMPDAKSPTQRDETEQSSPSSDASNDSNSNSDSDSVEALATGREKRTNAGNRMRGLVEEEEEDELTLLFGEEGEDEEFEESADEGSDHQITDSDDEDQASNAEEDDLAGEKELEREAKAEQAKKRKRQDIFTLPRKKTRPEPTVDQKKAAVPRPKKKKEHVFILAEEGDNRVRVSRREATKANREVMREKMKVDKVRQDAMKARLEERRLQREREKPKEMTQADRLREAERVEKKNAKSLNRWEELEKKRAEEQKAKLEALQNRKLEGPVLSWWSGIARWVGERLTRVGSRQTQVVPADSEPKKRGRKKKQVSTETPAVKENTAEPPDVGTPAESAATPRLEAIGEKEASTIPAPSVSTSEHSVPEHSVPERSVPERSVPEHSVVQTQEKSNSSQSTPIPPESPGEAAPNTEPRPSTGFLLGIHEYASQPPDLAQSTPTLPLTTESPAQVLPINQHDLSVPSVVPQHFQTSFQASYPPNAPLQPSPFLFTPAPPPQPSNSTRNLLILQNFDASSTAAHPVLFSNAKKTPKLTSKSFTHPFFPLPLAKSVFVTCILKTDHPSSFLTEPTPSLCPITSLPAKYRDSNTNIPYANATAYKKLRALEKARYQWSGMLGCYVGERGRAAMGVPEGFLPPTNTATATTAKGGAGAGAGAGAAVGTRSGT